MIEQEHADMVRELKKPSLLIWTALTVPQCDLIHMSMGIAGEGGELLDAIKKHVIYRQPLDRENVIEELGDLEFFMEGLRQHLDISRELTLRENYKKLRKRYPEESYTDEAAQARVDKQ